MVRDIPNHPENAKATDEQLKALHNEVWPVVKKLNMILDKHREMGVVPARIFAIRIGDTIEGQVMNHDSVVVEPVGP